MTDKLIVGHASQLTTTPAGPHAVRALPKPAHASMNIEQAMQRVRRIGDEARRRGNLLRFYIGSMQARTDRTMWQCEIRLHAKEFTTRSAPTPEQAISDAVTALAETDDLFKKCVEAVDSA